MSKTLKIISVILSVLTILGVFSVANPVLAAEVNEDYAITQKIENIKAEKEESIIIGEIESKRDKYTKVFQKSDGASVAVITSTPVHYKKDGEWVDIDNTLVEKTENNETVYENKSNDFTVTLPQEMDENDTVSIEKDGYGISFTLDGYDVFEKNEKSKAKKKEKVKKEKSKTKIDDSFIDKNETLVYESVGENTDIEYSVTATGLKEDIILTKKPKSEVSYTYTILAENLNGNPHEDGSVSFTDSKGNVIFNIPAPIMFDAKNKSSTDITVKFSGEKGNYKLTYTPSYNWLKKEAKYPVTIDPVVSIIGEEFTSNSLVATYVDSSNNDTNMGTLDDLLVMNSNDVEAIAYFNLSDSHILKSEMVLLNVELNVYAYNWDSVPVEIEAYPVTSNCDLNTITYDTKPQLSDAIDCISTAAGVGDYYSFDITNAYTTISKEAFGIALKAKKSSREFSFVSISNNSTSSNDYNPYIVINFYETTGVDSLYDYHIVDVGRAGTLYYNDFSDQVHIQREDIGLFCTYMPVDIVSYYNSTIGLSRSLNRYAHNVIGPFGYGWSMNYNQYVEFIDSEGSADDMIAYTNNMGQYIYFKATTTVENGKTVWKEVVDDYRTESGYTLYIPTSYSSNIGEYLGYITIKDSQNQIMSFNENGYLSRISTYIENTETSQKTEKAIIISYVNNSSYIDKITDGVERVYKFNYSTYNTYFKKLDSIQVYTASGAEVKVNNGNNSVPYKISYNYDTINFDGVDYLSLSSVTYPDGQVVNYDFSNNEKTIRNIDGYTIEIENLSIGEIEIREKVYKNNSVVANGDILKVSRNGNYKFEKVFTDKNQVSQTKQFDYYGRTRSTTNSDGKKVTRTYGGTSEALGEVLYGLYNIDSNSCIDTANNLIVNGSFSDSTGNWNQFAKSSIIRTDDSTKLGTYGCLEITYSDSGNTAVTSVESDDGKAGDSYILEFSVKVPSNFINKRNGNAFGVQILAKNSNNKVLDKMFLDVGVSENWSTYSYSFSVDEDYTDIEIYTIAILNENSVIYFDDIKLINTYKATATSGSSGSSGTTGGANSSTQCTCDGCTDFNCPCTNCGSNCTLTSCKRGFDFTNSASGSNVSITDGEKSMSFSSANDNNCNYPESQTDINGITTDYIYDPDTGLLTESTKGNNGTIEYSYNALGELASVSQTVSGLGTMQTSYSYENDRVKSITHNGFSYNYEYDVWGNVSSVKVGNQPLVSYNYDSGKNRNRINKITYGNGDYTVYTFNDNGNITAIKSYESSGSVKSIYQYTYSADGVLTAVLDVINKIQTLYNGQNVTVKHLNGSGTSDDVVYDTYTITDDGDIVETFGGMSYTTTDVSSTYKSSTGGSVDKSKLILNPENNTTNTPLKEYDFTSESDYFGRTLNKNTQTFYAEEDGINIDMFFKSQYKYKDLSTTQTTTLIDSYKSTVGLCAEIDGVLQTEVYEEIEYFYDYDNVGNITRIYFKEYDDDGSWLRNVTVCSYVYDKANQLVRENNATLEKTYVFVYDVGGNIVSKKEYEFAEGVDLSNVEPIDITNYSYDSVWKDKLEYFNDVEIKYDEIGNPINYVKKDVIDESSELGTLSWNGRQLESVIVGDSTYKYSYDADGLRTKTEMYDSDGSFNGAMYYLWRDGKLSGYTNVNSDGETEQTIKMLFDNTGESIGYTCYNATNNSEETFYFGKNVFGDIITVYSDDGDALVTYTYDAWGCFTAQAHGTTAAQIIAAIVALMFTPITYRGYNYDINTGLYYLQSRYYNPAYGRFLNADDTDILEVTKGTIHGANLFAYCNNNPVMNVDYTGELGFTIVLFGVTFAGAEALFVIGLISILVLAVIIPLILLMTDSIPGVTDNPYYNEGAFIDSLYKIYEFFSRKRQMLMTALYTTALLSFVKGFNKNTVTHHIIAQTSPKAAVARFLFEDVGGNVQSEENKVVIKEVFHWFLHTDIYFIAIDGLISESYYFHGNHTRQESVFNMLAAIKVWIQSFDAIAPWG